MLQANCPLGRPHLLMNYSTLKHFTVEAENQTKNPLDFALFKLENINSSPHWLLSSFSDGFFDSTGTEKINSKRPTVAKLYPKHFESWAEQLNTVVKQQCPIRFSFSSENVAYPVTICLCPVDENSVMATINESIESKFIRNELIKSKSILNEMGEMAKIGGWEHDFIQQKVFWTDTLYHIVNLDRAEDPPDIHTHYNHYHEEYREEVRRLYVRAIEQKIPFEIEVRYTDGNGEEKWAKIYGEPVVNNGKTEKLKGFFQDITEHKNTEIALIQSQHKIEQNNKDVVRINKKLKSSNKKILSLNEKLVESSKIALRNETLYKTIFDTSRESIFIYSSPNKLAYVNPSGCRLCYQPMEDLLKMTPDKFVPAECMDTVKKMFRTIEKGEEFFGEKMFKGPNNETICLQLYGCPIILNNEVLYYSAMIDISEQRKYESDIKAKNKFIANILELNPNLVYIINVEKYTTIYANKACWSCLGYNVNDNKDFLIDLINPHIHPDDKSVLAEHFSNIHKIDDGEVVQIEYRVKNVNGHYTWLFAKDTVFERNEQGKVKLIIGTATDISETKKIEQKLAVKNKEMRIQNKTYVKLNEELENSNDMLKKVNEELDSFVYRVSHDLRAPIASSIGLANLSLKEASTDHLKKYTEMQINSLTRLDIYIKDILNYSRNARLEMQVQEVNMHDLADELVGMLLTYDNLDKPVDFRINIEGSPNIYSDKLRLKIILNNLLSNSFKYHSNDINNPWVELKMSRKKDMVSIKVIDNGIGIGIEHQNNIYKMFYRGTTLRSGSGLGLYIVKDCLNKIGGSISFESEVAKGSEFEILIPMLALPQ